MKKYHRKLGVQSISDLHYIEKDKRDKIISKLRALEGVTRRNLSRITGISKSVIDCEWYLSPCLPLCLSV